MNTESLLYYYAGVVPKYIVKLFIGRFFWENQKKVFFGLEKEAKVHEKLKIVLFELWHSNGLGGFLRK